jgi:coenzyme F420-reducing hydrogenase beta subunit
MIEIQKKENCTGCHACKNVCPPKCIMMESDSEGFLYPKINIESCIHCGLCEKVCPIIHKKEINNNPKAYACYNKNEKIRMESSSGGLFTLIAEQIIDNGGIVFGARFDNEFNVIHDSVEKKEDLDKFRRSKYVQSKIGDTHRRVKDALIEGRHVLFTGTPCQVAGLKSFLGKEYDNLFCLDIICHGVPSPNVWKSYLVYQKNKFGSLPQYISFRNKDEGWKNFSMSISFDNNIEYRKTLVTDLYMKTFLKDICLRLSCYQCNFKTLHRQSDITLADFWGIQNMLPEMDDDRGTTLMFINSANGQKMMQNLNEKILIREVDINKAVEYNPSAIKSAKINPKRDAFLEDLHKIPFDKLVKKYCNDSIMIRLKRKSKALIYKVMKEMGVLNLYKKD